MASSKNSSSEAPPAAFYDLQPVPQIELFAPPFCHEKAEERRELYMTKLHSIPEKMQLYNSSTQGKIEDLKSLLKDKGFSVTEEVSKEGHYWTVLHYACHYGHIDVLEFLLDFLGERENSHEILNMQTVEGKTPLFCTILSGDTKLPVKKDIIKLLFETSQVDLSLRKVTGEDLLELAKKNQLYDYIVLYCLRED